MVLIDDAKVYCANIGDSRAVSIQNKKFVALSFDHKPEDRKEKARIQKEGGFVLDGRVCGSLSLSRAFGDLQFEGMVSSEPDVSVYSRRELELVVIGCDGIWESQEDYGQALTRRVQKELALRRDGKGVRVACVGVQVLRNVMRRELAKEITEQTMFGLDNMSAIVLELDGKARVKQEAGVVKKIRKRKAK